MSDNEIGSALEEYWAECDEIISRIDEHLRTIEKGQQSAEIIDSLYRDIHTLKGSSQLFGFKQVGEIAHAIENTLEPIRKNQTPIEAALLDVLLKGMGLIDRQIQSIKTSKTEVDAASDVSAFLASIAVYDTSAQTVAPVLAPAPVAAPIVAPVVAPVVQPALTLAPAPAPIAAPAAAKTESKVDAAASANPDAEGSTSIRVPVSLLDKLMNLMGEMVLVRNQVLQYANQSDSLEFLNLSQRLDVVTSEIQGEVMKTRMQPIGGILSKFHRVTRDLAKELGKKIELELIGVETELDKTLLEAVKDPIMHIVRNSCDHGLETIEDRRAAGKDVTGTITVRSYHEGGQVIVEISDDGRGLDRKKLINKAIEKGLLTPDRAETLSERDAFGLIFAPGFSTAAAVTNVSGRGVGMDVVKNNIEGIGGFVEIQSQLGRGTTTRLKIPLTLAIVPAMIVRACGERFAIPQVKLVELVRVDKEDTNQLIETLQGKPVLRLRGNILPLVRLQDVLNLKNTAPASDITNVVVLNAEGTLLGLIVDDVQDTAEVVVKPLNQFLKSLSLYSGATVLGDGSVALILDIVGIAKRQNLNSDVNSKLREKGDAPVKMTEEQEFLLFRLNSTSKHAIPLNLVHRLEEFAESDIEYSGGQRIVRYRNSALPIVSLNQFLGFPEPARTGSVPVIVTQKAGKMFGIEVDEIYDVLSTTSQMDDGFSDRVGIFGNLVTPTGLVVIVDTLRILDEMVKKLSVGGPTTSTAKVEVHTAGAKRKILFVEDTAFFRRHVATVLERAGYELTLCEHGLDALQTLERSKIEDFDLVLSDIEMPKMNGLQLAEAVRANERWKHVPMIALTTKFNPAHVEEGKRAGFDSYLEKLKPEILLAEITLRLQAPQKRTA